MSSAAATLPADVEAVLFDLDGVITDTATAHAAASKRVCDAYLAERASRTHEDVEPFDIDRDYYRHVDGKATGRRRQGIPLVARHLPAPRRPR